MRRTMSTVAALALAAGAAAGCAESVSGSPVTDVGAAGTVSITGGGNVITPAKLSTITCDSTADVSSAYCDAAPVQPRDIPSGSTITLRAGQDALRFVGSATNTSRDRLCTLGAFAKAGADTFALSGDGCAAQNTMPIVTTVDGYKIGVVTKILRSPTYVSDGPGGLWFVPAVKLDDAVRISSPSPISGTVTPAEYSTVTVTGAASGQQNNLRALSKGEVLTWDGHDPAPQQKPGDQGAPITQDGELVGFLNTRSGMGGAITSAARFVPRLDQLGAGAALVTS